MIHILSFAIHKIQQLLLELLHATIAISRYLQLTHVYTL